MKIYVDELPKCCKECPFMIDRGECNSSRLRFEENFVNCDCRLNPNIGYIGITKPHSCPLETTQSLKQQVREEVVEKIKNRLAEQRTKMQNDTHCYPQTVVCWQDIVAILDQVKGENNDN